MTRDEILEMVPGRELDALVAEKVMGWIPDGILPTIAPYSTDISAAWEVVEKLNASHWMKIERGRKATVVSFGNYGGSTIKGSELAMTAPLAICRAALLAVMDA